MLYISIIASLMLIQLFYFSFKVGGARGKFGVNAPAVSGNENFERVYRVHQNTQEQLIITLPAMFLFSHFFNPLIAATLGFVFIVGRFLYAAAYEKDPKSRGIGFLIGVIPTTVLMFGSLIGGIWELAKQFQ